MTKRDIGLAVVILQIYEWVLDMILNIHIGVRTIQIRHSIV